MTVPTAPQGNGEPVSEPGGKAAAELTSEAALLTELAPARSCVLDVGCGRGHLAARLHIQGCFVTGVDTSVDALRTARKYRTPSPMSLRFLNLSADTQLMGLSGDPFDLIVCRLVYPLLRYPTAFLRRAQVLLAPGGALAVIDHLLTAEADQQGHRGPGLTPTAVDALTTSAGWASVHRHPLDDGLTAFVLRTPAHPRPPVPR
ncbi:class I SAM-dependent methyltransferase [Streptomyces sp. H39-S7]|uniref:class I SAM-dependent methyltransferase n=1 Tax=Streptomyces sp. H39-S7 TaxID=3004357 RepID=UPI0022AFE60B|nr:class I SAM-dependent methyltransferase [Streptomyces sp. H39-S7]MCZ4124763.1 class I SAM-dependent methyltransferase [Streptomyces sp. H39-S7]